MIATVGRNLIGFLFSEKSTTRQRLISGTFWVLLGKGLGVVTSILLNAMLARLLPPAHVGAYFLIFSAITTTAALGQLGLSQAVTRLIAEGIGLYQPGRARKAIILSLTFTILATSIVSLIYVIGLGEWLANQWDSAHFATLAVPISIWILVYALQGVIGEIFRGFHAIHLATAFSGLIANLFVSLILLTVWLSNISFTLSDVLRVSVLAAFGAVVVSLPILWEKFRRLETTGVDSLDSRRLLSISIPILVTNIMFIVMTQADIWILGLYRPEEEVALYGAAVRLVTKIAMPLLLVNAVVPPLIAEMYAAKKHDKLQEVLRTTASVAGLPALLVLLIFAIFAGPILRVVYGEFYVSASRLLVILSVGQLVNVWSGSCALVLNMTGFHKEAMLMSILTGGLCLLAAFPTITHYGAIGAAVVVTSAISLRNVGMLLLTRRKTGIWTHMNWPRLRVWRVTSTP